MKRKWKPEKVEPELARLFLLAAFDDAEQFAAIRKSISRWFGQVDYETESIHSAQHLAALPVVGAHRNRSMIRILSFRRPIGREELVDLQNRCLEIMARAADEKGPTVELNPGYVTLYTVIRASLEEDFHRVYLYGGVFGEVLYYYEKMSFHPYSHSDPFYHRKDIITVFNDLRMIHKGETPQ